MSTTTTQPRRLAHVAVRCARCRDRGTGRLPNLLAIVDYLDTRTVVATAWRDGSENAATNQPHNRPRRRTRFHTIRGQGAQLECPDCRAKPRRSRKVILQLADEARAAGRDVCYVGD